MATQPPLFLVGAERSGTTAARLMLDHHPEIAWQNEFEYSVDLVSDGTEGDAVWPELEAYYDWLSTHRVFHASSFAIDRSLNYPELVKSFLEQRRNRDGKPIIGATVHRQFDRLLRIWPDARYLHIVRDPRDVARSNIGMGWAGNVWYGVDRWIEVEHCWERLKAGLTGDRYHEFRFEDLMQAPEACLREMCSFIGVDYSHKMLEYDRDTTYELPDASLTYQWKRKLSKREIALVESKVGDLLVTRGYEPDFNSTPSRPTPLELARLTLQNRWRRSSHRLTKYGLGLWIGMAISNRIGPRSVARRLQLRKNEIDRQSLK